MRTARPTGSQAEGDRHIVCVHCSGVNRVPVSRRAEDAKCGVCHEKLFSGHPRDIDGTALERQIARSTLPVLVDIWAPWCGPCRAMAPAYEAAARELEPQVRLVKLNSDNEQELSGRLGIRSIPTIILFRDGREVARTFGAMAAGQIVAWVRGRI